MSRKGNYDGNILLASKLMAKKAQLKDSYQNGTIVKSMISDKSKVETFFCEGCKENGCEGIQFVKPFEIK